MFMPTAAIARPRDGQRQGLPPGGRREDEQRAGRGVPEEDDRRLEVHRGGVERAATRPAEIVVDAAAQFTLEGVAFAELESPTLPGGERTGVLPFGRVILHGAFIPCHGCSSRAGESAGPPGFVRRTVSRRPLATMI